VERTPEWSAARVTLILRGRLYAFEDDPLLSPRIKTLSESSPILQSFWLFSAPFVVIDEGGTPM